MNNVLEFFVKMKDMMSGELVKLGRNSQQTFTKMKKDNKDFMTSLDGLRGKLKDLKFDMDGLTSKSAFKKMIPQVKELEREIKRLETAQSGKSGGMFGGIAGKLAPYIGAAAIGAAALSFGKASAQQFMDFERNNKTYEVLAGNKGIGQALGGELNQLKQDTILGTAVYDNSKMLMAFGDTADKVIPHLKMLGDVSMGDSEKLHRLTYAFGEVEAAGKLTGRQVMQFTNAGFNPLNEIAKQTGMSMTKVREELHKGKITFEMVEKAFEGVTGKGGRFHDMLNQIAGTTSGKLQNFHGKVAALEIAFGERLAPAINAALDSGSKFIVWLKHLVEVPVEKKLQGEIDKIRVLQGELTSSNTSHQRQLEILRELEQINPNLVRGINDQSISYSQLAKNIDEVTGALRNKIIVESFDKNSGGLLTKFKEAQQTLSDSDAKAKAMAFAALPDSIINRTDLTTGQKQAMGTAILKKNAEGATRPNANMRRLGFKNGYTKYEDYQDLLGDNSEALKFINENQKDYNSAQNKIAALNKSIDAVLGVKSMTAAQIKNGGGKVTGSGESGPDPGKDIASGITGGGPRVINISGVKFADKIELHAATMTEGTDDMERKLEEMFLRILNSGASIQ